MYIAKVNGNIVGEIVHYTKVFRSVPTDEQLALRGYKKINKYKPYNILTERLTGATPYVSGTYVFTVEKTDMTADEITSAKNSAMSNIRATRDGMLKDTDWAAIRKAETGTAMPSAMASYRQALRNVPATIGSADPRTWSDWPSISLDGSSASGV